jgi:hypothetical protein
MRHDLERTKTTSNFCLTTTVAGSAQLKEKLGAAAIAGSDSRVEDSGLGLTRRGRAPPLLDNKGNGGNRADPHLMLDHGPIAGEHSPA